MKSLITWTVVVVLLSVLCSMCMALEYEITFVPSLYGKGDCATDITNDGVIIGTTFDPSTSQGHAFVWDAVNGRRLLGALGPSVGAPRAINNFGKIVGRVQPLNTNGYACYWNDEGDLINLGTLPVTYPPSAWSDAYDVSDSGIIVGKSYADYAHYDCAVIWDSAGAIRSLGLMGGVRSFAFGINNLDQVVGYWQESGGWTRAFIWDEQSGFRPLQPPESATGCMATGISDNGQICGVSWAPGKTYVAYWDASGAPRTVAELPSGNNAYYSVEGINNSGQIIGHFYTLFTMPRAFIWDPVDGLTYLPAPNASMAFGINDLGQVAGWIRDPENNTERAVIWVPIPPPINITIDVLPDESPNVFLLQPNRLITVAILGSASFDVSQVDALSVVFGPGRATEVHQKGHMEDANLDGLTDMVFHFRCGDTGIQPGDSTVFLRGQLTSGEQIEGSDVITASAK